MKKLLLASAVLVGMGASQAFAVTAPSDSWSGTINLEMDPTCVLADPTITDGTKTFSAADILASPIGDFTIANSGSVDSDDDGLANDTISIDILFDGQSFCNYSHQLTVASQFNGFLANDGTTATAAATGSDDFLGGIPHKLTVTNWESAANTAVTWAEGTVETVYAAAPAAEGDWTALTTGTKVASAATAAYHNDGVPGTNANGEGLNLNLSYAGGSTAVPYFSGTYTDRLYVKIGATF